MTGVPEGRGNLLEILEKGQNPGGALELEISPIEKLKREMIYKGKMNLKEM